MSSILTVYAQCAGTGRYIAFVIINDLVLGELFGNTIQTELDDFYF